GPQHGRDVEGPSADDRNRERDVVRAVGDGDRGADRQNQRNRLKCPVHRGKGRQTDESPLGMRQVRTQQVPNSTVHGNRMSCSTEREKARPRAAGGNEVSEQDGRGAILVLPTRTSGQQGPVAGWLSTAGWAGAIRRVVGNAWIVTGDGVTDVNSVRKQA